MFMRLLYLLKVNLFRFSIVTIGTGFVFLNLSYKKGLQFILFKDTMYTYVTENEKTWLVRLKFKIEFLLSVNSPCFKLLPDGFDFAIWRCVAELHTLKALTAIKIKRPLLLTPTSRWQLWSQVGYWHWSVVLGAITMLLPPLSGTPVNKQHV